MLFLFRGLSSPLPESQPSVTRTKWVLGTQRGGTGHTRPVFSGSHTRGSHRAVRGRTSVPGWGSDWSAPVRVAPPLLHDWFRLSI